MSVSIHIAHKERLLREMLIPTFDKTTWSVGSAQARINAGKDITLHAGTYDLHTTGLDYTGSRSHLTMLGGAEFEHSGSGAAVTIGAGSTGDLEGLRLKGKGTSEGIGLLVDGSGCRVRDFHIEGFKSGVFCENSQIFKMASGLIRSCYRGIEQNPFRAQNLVKFSDIMFRTCDVSAEIGRARGVTFEFCDFEAAKDEAVIVRALGGGAIQSLVFRDCWFEGNNTSHVSADNVAEVLIDSGTGGYAVNSVRFTDCYWSFVNGSRPSKYRIAIGANDVAGVNFDGGFPAPMADINYL